MQHRTRSRLAVVVLAPAAALAAWSVARLAGIDLVVSRGGSRSTIGALDVLVAALAGALVGWLAVGVIERRSSRPRRRWAQVGSTGLALSLTGPNWFAHGGTAGALIALHVVTAVVVIIGFMRTLAPSGECEPAPLRWLRNARA
ncbi:MAG TPA: DUF6069 family protein [Gaiellales bacterium]|jgi:hypothetical protein